MVQNTQRQGDSLMRLTYRSDIDGLRAVAVMSVVAYHAFPDFLPGGFVGVDLFFVISGFLISGIILRGLKESAFSFRLFYARRIKRIFPALILVLMFCLALGWMVLSPNEYSTLGEHVAAGAGFISNILLWSESGYFDKASGLKPLLHLWSLGIEEQFYIVWPLLLATMSKKQIKPLYLLLFLLVTSFAVNLCLTCNSPVAAFYSPVTRFWELMLGSILACFNLTDKSNVVDSKSEVRLFMSVFGFLLILLSVALFRDTVEFPGWRAMLPVIGAGLLIQAGPDAFFNRVVLSRRVFVLVGLISYPLYLWHWPLLSFARIIHSEIPPAWVRFAIVILSLLLAYLTYRLIEKPIRFTFSTKRTAPALFLTMAIVGLTGFYCFMMNGMPARFSADIQSYVTYKYDPATDTRRGACWLEVKADGQGYSDDCVDPPENGKPLMLVWGDSHAARFYTGLKALAGDDFRLAQFARNACPPVLNYGYENCAKSNAYIIGKIKELRPAIVILHAHWIGYFKLDHNDAVIRSLAPTIQRLKEAGVSKIILVGPSPQWLGPLPNLLIKELRRNRSANVPERTYQHFDQSVVAVDEMLRAQLQGLDHVVYFSALNAMCDKTGCLTTINGRADGLTTWDEGHLTTPGALYLARKLAESTGELSAEER